MPYFRWRDFSHDLSRLVLAADLSEHTSARFRTLAARLGVTVGSPDTDPQPGDLWIACQPRKGWSRTDPTEVEAVAGFEVPIVLALLTHIIPTADYDAPDAGHLVIAGTHS